MYIWSIKLHYVLGTDKKNHKRSRMCQYPAVGLRKYRMLMNNFNQTGDGKPFRKHFIYASVT